MKSPARGVLFEAAMLRATRCLRLVLGLTGTLALAACDRAPRDLSPWSRTVPGTDGESLIALAVDPQGEPAITGVQTDPSAFDVGIPGTNYGANGLFMAMLSDAGGDLWGGASRAYGASGRGIAIAPNGDVLLLGSFSGALALDGHTLSSDGVPATVLARFDPRGKLIWSKVLGGTSTGSALGLSLATSASGDAVIGGTLNGEVDFGGGFVLGDYETSFVARFDESGNHQWSRAFRGGDHQVSAVAIDASGAVIAVGSGTGLLSFDAVDHGDDYAPNAFIAKLSPAGEPVFMTALLGASSGGYYPTLTAVTVDAEGGIVCGGTTPTTFTFGPMIFSAPEGAPFVAGLSSAGAPRWFSHFDGGFGTTNAVAVGADAKIYATGYYQGDHLDIGPRHLGATPGTAMFLAQLDRDGNVTDGRAFGDGTELSTGRALAVDPQGALLIGGHLRGSLTFQDRKLTSAFGGSSFIARLSPPFPAEPQTFE